MQKAPKTYNNEIDGLRAFVLRYLQKPDLIRGFKHTHVPSNFERKLPRKEDLKKAIEALENNLEKAIVLMFASSGLRLSELWNLKKDDVDFEIRCVKAKHDT